MMILIWIAIAAITACWAYREYGELLKVKTTRYPADDKGRRIKALGYMAANAHRNVTIIDYRSEVDDSLYENDDIARMIKWALEKNSELRIEIATAHRAQCWLLDDVPQMARTTMKPGAVTPGGQALVMMMDRGALAYIVNSWGSAKRYDCREVGQSTRELTLGAHIAAAENLFNQEEDGQKTTGATRAPKPKPTRRDAVRPDSPGARRSRPAEPDL